MSSCDSAPQFETSLEAELLEEFEAKYVYAAYEIYHRLGDLVQHQNEEYLIRDFIDIIQAIK